RVRRARRSPARRRPLLPPGAPWARPHVGPTGLTAASSQDPPRSGESVRVEQAFTARRSVMVASRPSPPGKGNGMTPRGIASRAGVWSAQHRKMAIWGWIAFVLIAFMVGGAVGTKTLEHSDGSVGESGRADRTIADAAPEYAQEMVLVQSSAATANEPSFRA